MLEDILEEGAGLRSHKANSREKARRAHDPRTVARTAMTHRPVEQLAQDSS